MPTCFSNCDECNYNKELFSYFDSFYDKKKVYAINETRGTDLINYIVFNENVEKQNILIKLGLPKEIAQKIIKISQEESVCEYCKSNVLCTEHSIESFYKGIQLLGNQSCKMCNECWWVVYRKKRDYEEKQYQHYKMLQENGES